MLPSIFGENLFEELFEEPFRMMSAFDARNPLYGRHAKNIMKTGNVEGKTTQDFFGNLQTPFRLVNNKVIVPDEEEIARNPRSRSAKLRIAEKK